MAGIEFRAVGSAEPVTAASDLRDVGTLIGRVEWPDELAAQGLHFFIENLLTERMGTEAKARALLERGYRGFWAGQSAVVGSLLANERPRFLSDRAFFPPVPDEALATQVDLEDLVALFSVVLKRIRELPPEADVVMVGF